MEDRYTRQVILEGFGEQAQKKLDSAKVLVVGAGGLGVPVLQYLNAMGIGMLGIVDQDVISLSNLHRQVLYAENEVGKSKVKTAIEKLQNQNKDTKLVVHDTFLTRDNALEIIKDYDVVIDASDNFPTRYLINDACVILKKAFVYGALHAFEGQVSVFNFNGGPTYRCLFPKMPDPDEVPNCNDNGVLGVLPGIIGNFQALETVKLLTGIGNSLSGKLLLYNALDQSILKVNLSLSSENLNIETLQTSYDHSCGDLIETISSSEFQKLQEKNSLQVIDVRTTEEFQNFHLENSKHIPLAEIEKEMKKIKFDQPAFFICQSGIRSLKAIQKIQNLNPTAKLINVSGGIQSLPEYAASH